MSDNFYIRNCLIHGVFDTIDKDHIFDKDNYLYNKFREYITKFIQTTVTNHHNALILEIGPKNYKANPLLIVNNNNVETVDIIPNSETTYVCDLTATNNIPKKRFDVIYCLEVIEHCSHPLSLLKELKELLKDDGILYLSFPFQFRLHGPIPDNWRISEYGIRILLNDAGFTLQALDALIERERPAFPVSYTAICIKQQI